MFATIFLVLLVFVSLAVPLLAVYGAYKVEGMIDEEVQRTGNQLPDPVMEPRIILDAFKKTPPPDDNEAPTTTSTNNGAPEKDESELPW